MRHDRRSLRGGGTAPLKVWNASIFPHTQFLAISLVVRLHCTPKKERNAILATKQT